jgi:hypothetical protein
VPTVHVHYTLRTLIGDHFLAQAAKEEKMFSSFSEPKRKITGEILLEASSQAL